MLDRIMIWEGIKKRKKEKGMKQEREFMTSSCEKWKKLNRITCEERKKERK